MRAAARAPNSGGRNQSVIVRQLQHQQVCRRPDAHPVASQTRSVCMDARASNDMRPSSPSRVSAGTPRWDRGMRSARDTSSFTRLSSATHGARTVLSHRTGGPAGALAAWRRARLPSMAPLPPRGGHQAGEPHVVRGAKQQWQAAGARDCRCGGQEVAREGHRDVREGRSWRRSLGKRQHARTRLQRMPRRTRPWCSATRHCLGDSRRHASPRTGPPRVRVVHLCAALRVLHCPQDGGCSQRTQG